MSTVCSISVSLPFNLFNFYSLFISFPLFFSVVMFVVVVVVVGGGGGGFGGTERERESPSYQYLPYFSIYKTGVSSL